jgi:hypothetical protein
MTTEPDADASDGKTEAERLRSAEITLVTIRDHAEGVLSVSQEGSRAAI